MILKEAGLSRRKSRWDLHYIKSIQNLRKHGTQRQEMNKRQKKKKYGKDWEVWMVLWGGHPKRMFAIPKKSPYEVLTTTLALQRVRGGRKKGRW